jgi:hypothetical protein
MPATDPFSRASLASEGLDTCAAGAAGKQSVGLAGLPGFFLLALALVRRIRLLFNAGSLGLSLVFTESVAHLRRPLVRETTVGLGGNRSIQDRSLFPQDRSSRMSRTCHAAIVRTWCLAPAHQPRSFPFQTVRPADVRATPERRRYRPSQRAPLGLRHH